jgi:hypothetical protein
MGTGTATMVGKQAPGLALDDTSGERQALPPAGTVPATVVIWTCNHCPYALAWHERMADVARDYAERGVRVLAVNSNDAERYPRDSFEAMRERVEAEPDEWPFPYLHDATQEAARAWNAQTTPHVYVLDANGVIRYEGAPDADHQQPALRADWLRGALDAVLNGSEPDPAATDPEGCSIKWRQ